MTFGPYEIFSIISGIVLVLCAFVPAVPVKERFWAFVGGAFFIGYGFYVAHQTSGTFYFPWPIFVVPFLGVGYIIVKIVTRPSRDRA